MIFSTSGIFFSTLAELIKSFFPNRVRILSTKPVAGIEMLSTSVKLKEKLHNRKTEHFKALTQIGHASAVADHSVSTGHNIKWDQFEILANGPHVINSVKSRKHC